MSNHPNKKPRLIIIKKEQDKSTPDRAELRLSDHIVRHSPNSIASLGGTPPLPLERSCAVGGRLPPPLTCTRFNNKTWQEYQDWMTTNQQTYEQIYKRPLKCIYGAPREISHKKIPPQAQILVIEMNNDENRIMGIGEIINQTASEVYRSPSAVVPLTDNTAPLPPTSGHVMNQDDNTAPLPPTSGHVMNQDDNTAPLPPTSGPAYNPAHNATSLLPINRAELPSRGGGTPSGTRLPFRKIFSDRNYTRYIYIGNSHYATREELDRNHTQSAQYINEHLANTITMPQTPHPVQHPPTPITMIEYLERLLFKGHRHMKRGSGITGVAPPLPSPPQRRNT
jgi:hypothetical protein